MSDQLSITPQLSSVSTALSELTDRVTALAESLSSSQREDLAAALYEVERALTSAGRRLDQVVTDLR